MKLYFGNTTTTITTLMILCLLGFIGYTIFQRANILYWGRRTLFVLVFGLVICCFAAARDGLDKTIQHTIDGSCAPGIFPLLSIPNLIGCISAPPSAPMTIIPSRPRLMTPECSEMQPPRATRMRTDANIKVY